MKPYVYEFFSVVCYVILCRMFVGIFSSNPRRMEKRLSYCIVIGLICLNYGIVELAARNPLGKEVLITGVMVLAMQLLFEGKRSRVFILTLLYQSGSFLVGSLTGFLMKEFYSMPVYPASLSTSVVFMDIFSKNIQFHLIMFLALYLRKNNIEMLQKLDKLRLAGVVFFSTLLLIFNWEILLQGSRNRDWYLVIAFLIMNIVLSDLITGRIKRELEIRREKIYRNKVENETKLYRTLSESYEKQRKREHEYKNQILCITALAQEGKYRELDGYLAELERKTTGSMELFDTNHSIVNTILNLKYQEARKKEILFVVKINDLSEIPFTDEDVVILLSNLLNNAMEACEQCEKKIIKLKFVKEYNKLVLSVTNTLAKQPERVNGEFRTSKVEQPENHGIGIANICEIVEKYGGSYAITYDEQEFRFAILLYCNGSSVTMNPIL